MFRQAISRSAGAFYVGGGALAGFVGSSVRLACPSDGREKEDVLVKLFRLV